MNNLIKLIQKLDKDYNVAVDKFNDFSLTYYARYRHNYKTNADFRKGRDAVFKRYVGIYK